MRTSRSRGGTIAVLLAAAISFPPCEAAAQNADRGGSREQQKFLGNVWSAAQLPDFTRFFDQVTPENVGKWGPMEPVRGQMNWEPLDRAYAFARENGFPFRFHVLVWGNQQPAWLEDLPVDEQVDAIHRRFASIAERYPEIDYLEVVNEPLHDPPLKRDENDLGSGNYFEALGGTGETGWDWVLNAFRFARHYFPNTSLVLNEYGVTNSRASAERYLGLIELLQREHLIDVIGVQGHSFATTVPSDTTRHNLDLLASSGLPIQVTEMDIDGPSDEIQLAEYQRIFPIFWEHPAVVGVTLWGWRPGMWRTRHGANLVREDGSHRPAFDWLLEYTRRGSAQ